MRPSKIFLATCFVLLACAGAYAAFMYVYTDHMFAPVPLLAQPSPQAPASTWTAPKAKFIHRVNSPTRARFKDHKFNGFELDVWMHEGQPFAAHGQTELQRDIPLGSIFGAVENPAQKAWWLDLKTELTETDLQAILQTAQEYHIPTENLLFEAGPGPTAKLIKQYHLGLLLALPEGFEEDHQDPQKRAELNAQVLALWQEYQPAAVSASFGKYGHLRAYYPNMPKAIYYSATRRPSLKKYFMAAHMQKDPSVQIFMTDEYTWINL